MAKAMYQRFVLLLITPETIVCWRRNIVQRRSAAWSMRGRSE